ncbi:MAG: DUF2334 domain-containing protein [Candidatus Thorarchaeota archaeon]
MGKRITLVPDQTILLSIHDISPVYEDCIIKTCDRLADMGITSYSMLVTPFFQMKTSNYFEKNEFLAEYLQSLGIEISLHGYSHQSKSGSLDEFNKMLSERMRLRLKQGMALFRKSFARNPIGFVPPMWKAPIGLIKLAKDAGLEYCIIGDKIQYLGNDIQYTTNHLIISQGDGRFSYSNAMLELELGGSIQIAVHPKDVQSNTIFQLLEDLIDRLGYSFTGYSDFLKSI